MATPKKIQYKDYADYLKSPKWKQVKQDYRDNEDTGNCLVCNLNFKNISSPANYHHFRYEKDWNCDTWENLLIVCERCHGLLHSLNRPDSRIISLRSYLCHMNEALRGLIQYEKNDSHNDDLWCATKGNFSITSKGVKRFKTMELSLVTEDPSIIAYFEKRTDACIKEAGN